MHLNSIRGIRAKPVSVTPTHVVSTLSARAPEFDGFRERNSDPAKRLRHPPQNERLRVLPVQATPFPESALPVWHPDGVISVLSNRVVRASVLAAAVVWTASLEGAEPQSAAGGPRAAIFGPAQFPDSPEVRFPRSDGDSGENRGCNVPSASIDASLRNDNRRTTGLVLAKGGYFPPVQQSMLTARWNNIQCRKVDGEISAWYSLHDARVFEEKRFQARGMFEPFARVHVYGGISYYDNPKDLFSSRSIFFIGGAEYPTVLGMTFNADYLWDAKEHGEWLTLQVTKRHTLGTIRRGAVFTYKHGLGATGTHSLPGNTNTASITGVPSVFYRAILEIDDGPVTWYMEASPHLSFVSRATGVRKKHVLVAVGLRMDFP